MGGFSSTHNTAQHNTHATHTNPQHTHNTNTHTHIMKNYFDIFEAMPPWPSVCCYLISDLCGWSSLVSWRAWQLLKTITKLWLSIDYFMFDSLYFRYCQILQEKDELYSEPVASTCPSHHCLLSARGRVVWVTCFIYAKMWNEEALFYTRRESRSCLCLET